MTMSPSDTPDTTMPSPVMRKGPFVPDEYLVDDGVRTRYEHALTLYYEYVTSLAAKPAVLDRKES